MKTKLIITLTALLMLVGINAQAQVSSQTTTRAESTELEGDLNHDGKVNVADVTYLVDLIMKQSTSGYYWYIGVDNPSSISNIQTSNTVPGWHEIGSSLSGFVLNTDTNVIDLGTSTRVIYNVIIPEELHIYASDGTTNVESIYFNSITSNIPGYKAFKVIPSEYYPEGEWDVCGIVIK